MKDILTALFMSVSWRGIFMTKGQELPLTTKLLRWWLLCVAVVGSSLALIDYANHVFLWW